MSRLLNICMGESLIAEMNKEAAEKKMAEVGLDGFDKPKELRGDASSHHVMANLGGGEYKYIKFGQSGADTVPGKPKNDKERAKKKSFKSRFAKDIAKGKSSAAYWADKVKW